MSEAQAQDEGGRTQPPKSKGAGKPRPAAELLLARRLAGLPAGRYEIIITVDRNNALADWSVRFAGKVEGP